jgi:hypothetical protein
MEWKFEVNDVSPLDCYRSTPSSPWPHFLRGSLYTLEVWCRPNQSNCWTKFITQVGGVAILTVFYSKHMYRAQNYRHIFKNNTYEIYLDNFVFSTWSLTHYPCFYLSSAAGILATGVDSRRQDLLTLDLHSDQIYICISTTYSSNEWFFLIYCYQFFFQQRNQRLEMPGGPRSEPRFELTAEPWDVTQC